MVFPTQRLVSNPCARGTTNQAECLFPLSGVVWEAPNYGRSCAPGRQETNDWPAEEEPVQNYEDAPFGIFVRFGGGRGGLLFRYKGHVRHSSSSSACCS